MAAFSVFSSQWSNQSPGAFGAPSASSQLWPFSRLLRPLQSIFGFERKYTTSKSMEFIAVVSRWKLSIVFRRGLSRLLRVYAMLFVLSKPGAR